MKGNEALLSAHSYPLQIEQQQNDAMIEKKDPFIT